MKKLLSLKKKKKLNDSVVMLSTAGILVVMVAIGLFLSNGWKVSAQDATYERTQFEKYDGHLQQIYPNINKSDLFYDPMSEVVYRKKTETVFALYYGDNLLHYCPHNKTEGVGMFYILQNDEPITVTPDGTKCPIAREDNEQE